MGGDCKRVISFSLSFFFFTVSVILFCLNVGGIMEYIFAYRNSPEEKQKMDDIGKKYL